MNRLTNKQLGNTVMTIGINQLLDDMSISIIDIQQALSKHTFLNYGELCKEDIEVNNSSIKNDLGTVMSKYFINNICIWIITYLNDYTVILLPSEY
ncbi:hypothetical protein [Clostridium thermobutyricum]|uniref:hypothetical protein n=1 Tax=Clostridium thermobutyricum TaxID=29372 RepID=UPI0018AAB48F|nr:hypothetical protein [Clostridium thermobutyricum]